MKDEDKVYSLLGFAARQRKLVFGKERVRGYIKSPLKSKMVIVAKDASERLKYDLKLRCENAKVYFLEMFTKQELGKLLGRDEVSAMGVEDENIVEGVRKYLEEE